MWYLVSFFLASNESVAMWMDYPPVEGEVINLPDGSGRYGEVENIVDIKRE